MLATLFTTCIGLAGAGTERVAASYYSARDLARGVVTPGEQNAVRVDAATRLAGDLKLDGWVADGIWFFSQAPKSAARGHLETVRSVVRGLAPVVPQGRAHDVLFVFHLLEKSSYALLLERLARSEPTQAEFLRRADDLCGIALPDARCCLLLDDSKVVPLERHQNLLVHLAAHVAVATAHGALPQWLNEGLALEAEQRATRSLYAFCDGCKREPPAAARFRTQVATAWDGSGVAAIDRLLAADQDRLDEATAIRAMTSVRWLREHHPEELAEAIRRIGRAYQAGEMQDEAQRVAGQEAIFRELLGEGFRAPWLEGAKGAAARGRAP